MKIGQQFNKLTRREYVFYIDNHKKYTDFNTLGLYRSILENEKLSLEDKLEISEYAHKIFRKAFDFLQLKDPQTFFDITTLGQNLTKGEEQHHWDQIKENQQKILSAKRIKHRNFGYFSKHSCSYADCPFNGLMIRQGSRLAEGHMWFSSDKSKYSAQSKSERRKVERKMQQQTIGKALEDE